MKKANVNEEYHYYKKRRHIHTSNQIETSFQIHCNSEVSKYRVITES